MNTKVNSIPTIWKHRKLIHAFDNIYFPGRKGRPGLDIEREELLLLYRQGFTVKQMGSKLGCSSKYIHRRLACENLTIRGRYTTISDDDLRSKIADLHNKHPKAGIEVNICINLAYLVQASFIILQFFGSKKWKSWLTRARLTFSVQPFTP